VGDDLPARLRERADAHGLARGYLEPVATLLREAAAEIEALRAAAALALKWLDGRQDNRAGDKEAAKALRAALGPGVTTAPPAAGGNADNDDAE
jgi:hypothetical protein